MNESCARRGHLLGVSPLAACLLLSMNTPGIGSTPTEPSLHAEPLARQFLGSTWVGTEAAHFSSDIALRVAKPRSKPAGALLVTNCDDAGPGSLRDTVAGAISGDTIDLTQLPCSTITLTSGAIPVLQDDLALAGPGAGSLAINGGDAFSILRHAGAGTLSVDGVTLTHGYFHQYYGHGGCVFSPGNVALYDSVVSNCVVRGGYARGGGIFAVHDLTLVNTLVTGNLADGGDLTSSGGGFLVGGYLLVQNSTISNNIALTTPAPNGKFSVGGAADTFGDVVIEGSTISGNQAKNVAGPVFEAHGTPTAVMIDSTVSGNIATDHGPFGGVYSGIPLSIYNSTIAFNTGTGVSGLVSAYPIVLQSTIIADNVPRDFRLYTGGSVTGSNNLITIASVVPPDTIRDCARLGPLADNGGTTLTHPLLHASPALDTGNDTIGVDNDQRGPGFPRVVGANADIGAFEWQGEADDELFLSRFEVGCDH